MKLVENMSAKRKLDKGIALTKQATENNGATADKLFAEAFESLAGASVNDKYKEQALHRWGLALYEQAGKASGDKANEFYQLAYEKYAAAAEFKGQRAETLNDWGVALLAQARIAPDDEDESAGALLEQAKVKLHASEAAFPGTSAYNLACVYSLMNNPEECREHLESAKSSEQLPLVAHIRQDKDMDNVCSLDWFEEVLKGVK